MEGKVKELDRRNVQIENDFRHCNRHEVFKEETNYSSDAACISLLPAAVQLSLYPGVLDICGHVGPLMDFHDLVMS